MEKSSWKKKQKKGHTIPGGGGVPLGRFGTVVAGVCEFISGRGSPSVPPIKENPA